MDSFIRRLRNLQEKAKASPMEEWLNFLVRVLIYP